MWGVKAFIQTSQQTDTGVKMCVSLLWDKTPWGAGQSLGFLSGLPWLTYATHTPDMQAGPQTWPSLESSVSSSGTHILPPPFAARVHQTFKTLVTLNIPLWPKKRIDSAFQATKTRYEQRNSTFDPLQTCFRDTFGWDSVKSTCTLRAVCYFCTLYLWCGDAIITVLSTGDREKEGDKEKKESTGYDF